MHVSKRLDPWIFYLTMNPSDWIWYCFQYLYEGAFFNRSPAIEDIDFYDFIGIKIEHLLTAGTEFNYRYVLQPIPVIFVFIGDYILALNEYSRYLKEGLGVPLGTLFVKQVRMNNFFRDDDGAMVEQYHRDLFLNQMLLFNQQHVQCLKQRFVDTIADHNTRNTQAIILNIDDITEVMIFSGL